MQPYACVVLKSCSVVVKNMASTAATGVWVLSRVDEAFLRDQNVILACAKLFSTNTAFEAKTLVTIVVYFRKA